MVTITGMHSLSLVALISSMHCSTAGECTAPVVEALCVQGPTLALSNERLTSSLQTPNESAPEKNKVAHQTRFGAKDSWRWQITGSWMNDFDSANQLEAEWSASWFFMENVSMDFGVSGDAILQPGLDAGGGGASLMFRWHFLARESWSVYADAGCGLLFTNEPVPSDGGKVNFTPRVGVGGTYAIHASMRLMGGVRWYHISNANTSESNPSRDSIQLYGGISLPF